MSEKELVSPLNVPDDKLDDYDWNQLIPEEKNETDDTTTDDVDDLKENEDDKTETKDEKILEKDTETSTEDIEDSTTDTDDTDIVIDKSKDDDKSDEKVTAKDNVDTDVIDDKEKSDSKEKEKKEELEVNFKEEYNKIMSPFKANGKMIQMDNVEDVRTLLQMGANYSKKMAALKPNLRFIKMLENNDLLDETKINYLIDLDKKNLEAIKKLVQESKIDVLDLDPEEKVDYKPNTYTVDDQEVDVKETLLTIKETDSYETTLDIISNKWDKDSQDALYKSPDIIPVINEQVGNGIYTQITDAVEKERMVGRLKGVSDLRAYKIIGDKLTAQGVLKSNDDNTTSKDNITNISQSKTKQTVDPKRAANKKAAKSTKNLGGTAKVKTPSYNPLEISDKDFEKIAQKKFA